MSDWLEPGLVLLPLTTWMFLVVGIPWALALLPRGIWPERITVLAVGMALGPLAVTAVMFVLGTFATITLVGTLVGGSALAVVGYLMARRRRSTVGIPRRVSFTYQERLTQVEQMLIAGVVVALLINIVITAYWPFVAYDPLWVYAHNAKVFFNEKAIPDDLGYYPPHISLSYTFMQQAWGSINDHAARAVIPWYNIAMTLMAYVLGRRAFYTQRAAILTMAFWALYPHVAAWGGAGDLEIPLTLYMTGAAAFTIEAWRTESRRSAILAGVMLGGALWTKPTAGAFALGVVVCVVGSAVVMRHNLKLFWPKLRLAMVIGLASAPLGGVWYIRNLLLGHTAVDFPASYWHGFAQRSGQELGWPLLVTLLFGAALILYPPAWLRGAGRWGRIGIPLFAIVLLLAGTLPSAVNFDTIDQRDNLWQWMRGDLGAAHRLQWWEIACLVAGIALLAWPGFKVWKIWPDAQRETVLLLWGLALPYAIVWFWNFSYHYRLSFAIVPLFAVQAAALIDGWFWDWLDENRLRRVFGGGITVSLCVVAFAAGLEFSADVWQDGGLEDDMAKYDKANPALMRVVHMLEGEAEARGEPLVVSIPGEDRLPFFFPDWDIRNPRDYDELPTSLEDLDGVDIFIDNSIYRRLLIWANKLPNSLVADAAVGATYHELNVPKGWAGEPWPTVLEPIPLHETGALPIDDGNFRYTAYAINRDARFAPMLPGAPQEDAVIIGDFARFVGHDVTSLAWPPGGRVFVSLYWRPTEKAPPPRDYAIYIHLLDEHGDLLSSEDGTPLQWSSEPLQGAYPTRFWRPGESLLDYWVINVPEDAPPGPACLRIGIFDPLENERLPVIVDGQATGEDGVDLLPCVTIP